MLPSIRQLARDLKISVITTTRAYSDLEQEGFIVIVQGKGCYVLPKNRYVSQSSFAGSISPLFKQLDITSFVRYSNLHKNQIKQSSLSPT